uniref:Uncharacterized protein n=1 Tax=Candidozyma auris TaxID=498019 RepID=A0A0L0P8K0_CANAR
MVAVTRGIQLGTRQNDILVVKDLARLFRFRIHVCYINLEGMSAYSMNVNLLEAYDCSHQTHQAEGLEG